MASGIAGGRQVGARASGRRLRGASTRFNQSFKMCF